MTDPLPLEGLVVLDIATWIAAPAAARPELRLEFRSGEQALREAILAAIAAGDARLRR